MEQARHSAETWRSFNEFRLIGFRQSITVPIIGAVVLTANLAGQHHVSSLRDGLLIGLDLVSIWWACGAAYAMAQIRRHLGEGPEWWERRTRLAWKAMCWWAPIGLSVALALVLVGAFSDRRGLFAAALPFVLVMWFAVWRAMARSADPTNVFSPVRVPLLSPRRPDQSGQ